MPQHPQGVGVLLQWRHKPEAHSWAGRHSWAGGTRPKAKTPGNLLGGGPCAPELPPPWGFHFYLDSARGCWNCEHQCELNWVVPKMSHFGSSFVEEKQGRVQ